MGDDGHIHGALHKTEGFSAKTRFNKTRQELVTMAGGAEVHVEDDDDETKDTPKTTTTRRRTRHDCCAAALRARSVWGQGAARAVVGGKSLPEATQPASGGAARRRWGEGRGAERSGRRFGFHDCRSEPGRQPARDVL